MEVTALTLVVCSWWLLKKFISAQTATADIKEEMGGWMARKQRLG